MPTAIYARKSTERDDRQVQSLEDQVKVLTDLARREGITVCETFVESGSAKAPGTRPEFARLVEAIQAGRIDGILTWSPNRLSRNPVDGGLIAYLLQTGKLNQIRTTERTYRPEDNALIMAIENGMSTNMLQELSRNVRRGMKGKADRGWHPGRAPLGYVNDPASRQIVPDPRRFALLRKGWDMLLTGGYTVAEIHRELTELGLTGIQRGNLRKPVAPSVVYHAFASRFYAGEFYFSGEWRKGKHRPMVSATEFEQAQLILGRRLSRKKRKGQMYAGMIRCGRCGCQIVGETKRKYYAMTDRHVSYTYYHCTGARGCPKRCVHEETITARLLEIFDSIKVTKPFVEWANWAMLRFADRDSVEIAAVASTIRAQMESEGERLDRVRELRIAGEIDAEEYRQLKADCDAKSSTLARRLDDLLNQTQNASRRVRERLEFSERAGRFREMAEAAKRAAISGLGEGHCLTLEKLEFRVDSVLQKIATFEPLRNGSEIPKVGDLLPLNSVWYSLLEDLLTAARSEVSESGAGGTACGQPLRGSRVSGRDVPPHGSMPL